jgi:hypothetical protein
MTHDLPPPKWQVGFLRLGNLEHHDRRGMTRGIWLEQLGSNRLDVAGSVPIANASDFTERIVSHRTSAP